MMSPGPETSGMIMNAKRSAMSRTKLGERCYKYTFVAIERTSKKKEATTTKR